MNTAGTASAAADEGEGHPTERRGGDGDHDRDRERDPYARDPVAAGQRQQRGDDVDRPDPLATGATDVVRPSLAGSTPPTFAAVGAISRVSS